MVVINVGYIVIKTSDKNVLVPFRGMVVINLDQCCHLHTPFVLVLFRGMVVINETMLNRKQVAVNRVLVPFRGMVVINHFFIIRRCK